MVKLEKILGVIISSIMMLMLLFLLPLGALLLTLSVLILILLHSVFGFALFNKIPLKNLGKKEAYKGVSTMRIIGSIGAGFALMTLVVGILFVFLRWPFGYVNLTNGLVMAGIVLLISIIKIGTTKNDASFYKRMIIRVGIISFIGFLLRFTPTETLFELKCHGCPESYIEAEKALMKDPENPELIKKADEESEKYYQQQ
ncbi:hypothetical protein U8527_13440 [Kordia algicida OT-1]|uniref:Uncharacterized protein n=1 Tax=Kordia algicida OT-1 TaxID=391587 RepID=A9E5T1_9FLAO|nr:hypothetical protein [Kordia algicida]EDP95217.1 hypothetical protein KAOT1_07027 [Kordia algicida OT-1]